MEILILLLLLAAAVCFGIAAFSRNQPRINLVALGLLLWVAVPLLQTLVGLDA